MALSHIPFSSLLLMNEENFYFMKSVNALQCTHSFDFHPHCNSVSFFLFFSVELCSIPCIYYSFYEQMNVFGNSRTTRMMNEVKCYRNVKRVKEGHATREWAMKPFFIQPHVCRIVILFLYARRGGWQIIQEFS